MYTFPPSFQKPGSATKTNLDAVTMANAFHSPGNATVAANAKTARTSVIAAQPTVLPTNSTALNKILASQPAGDAMANQIAWEKMTRKCAVCNKQINRRIS